MLRLRRLVGMDGMFSPKTLYPEPRIAFCVLMILLISLPLSARSSELAPDPYPLEYFALREVIDNVRVSPDGRHLALMKIAARDADPVIEIYDAADLAREPFRVNADPMEITGFYWVSDVDIVMTLRQRVRDRIDGFNEGVYEYRLAKVDIERKSLRSFKEADPQVESVPVNDSRRIIISFQPGGDRDTKIDEAFRPRAYYSLDLETGNKRLLLRGKLSLGQIEFDGEGNPGSRAASTSIPATLSGTTDLQARTTGWNFIA